MRTFFAIDISNEARMELAQAARSWDIFQRVNPANFHITLAFLGDIAFENLSKLQGIAADVVVRHQAFSITLDTLLTKRDMLWAVAAGTIHPLMQLERDLVGRLVQEQLMEPPKRDFNPHVKLGFTDAVGKRRMRPVTFDVSEFVLYQTEFLDRGGVKYHRIADFKFEIAD